MNKIISVVFFLSSLLPLCTFASSKKKMQRDYNVVLATTTGLVVLSVAGSAYLYLKDESSIPPESSIIDEGLFDQDKELEQKASAISPALAESQASRDFPIRTLL